MKKTFIVLMLCAVSSVFTASAMNKAIEAKALRELVGGVEEEMDLERADGSITPQTAEKARLIEKLCVVTGQQKSAARLYKKRAGIEKSNRIKRERGVKKPTAQRKLNFDDIDFSEEL